MPSVWPDPCPPCEAGRHEDCIDKRGCICAIGGHAPFVKEPKKPPQHRKRRGRGKHEKRDQ